MGRVALLGLIELQRSDPKRSAHPIPFAYGSRPHFSIIIGERQPTYATVIPRAVPAKAHSQRVTHALPWAVSQNLDLFQGHHAFRHHAIERRQECVDLVLTVDNFYHQRQVLRQTQNLGRMNEA